MKPKEKTQVWYICGTELYEEVTVEPFPTIEMLKQHKKCTDSCGVVALTVKPEWIELPKHGDVIVAGKKFKEFKKARKKK